MTEAEGSKRRSDHGAAPASSPARLSRTFCCLVGKMHLSQRLGTQVASFVPLGQPSSSWLLKVNGKLWSISKYFS